MIDFRILIQNRVLLKNFSNWLRCKMQKNFLLTMLVITFWQFTAFSCSCRFDLLQANLKSSISSTINVMNKLSHELLKDVWHGIIGNWEMLGEPKNWVQTERLKITNRQVAKVSALSQFYLVFKVWPYIFSMTIVLNFRIYCKMPWKDP